MQKKKISFAKTAALVAAGISGVVAPMAAPIDAGAPTVRQSAPRTERTATTQQNSARAAFGISMMGGDAFGPVYGTHSAPWLAPRFNQRKARRDARRVNRGVRRG